MKNCNQKISLTCDGQQQAQCSSYEGTVNSQSAYDNTDCLNLEETTQDVYNQLEDIQNQLDLEDLGEGCLTYENKLLKTILLKQESEICSLKEKVQTLENTSVCDMSIAECGLDLTGIVDACGEQPQTLGELLQILITN